MDQKNSEKSGNALNSVEISLGIRYSWSEAQKTDFSESQSGKLWKHILNFSLKIESKADFEN